jgi:hypothetical protein
LRILCRVAERFRESFPEGGWNFHRDIDKFGAFQKSPGGHGVAATGNRKTMSNQVIEIQVQGDFIERLTSARPVQALAELVWNALDSDAARGRSTTPSGQSNERKRAHEKEGAVPSRFVLEFMLTRA